MAEYLFDEDALFAAVDLVGRCGATGFDLGFLHDDVPIETAAWYAFARFKGTRVIEEGYPGPVEAAEALARRLLTGAKCVSCGGLIALSDAGAIAYEQAQMADGSTWTVEQARAAGLCRWERRRDTWVSGCKAPGSKTRTKTVRHRGQTKRKRR